MIKLVSEICIFFYCLSIYYIIFIATRYVAATSFSGKFIENVVFFIFLVKILKKLGFGFAIRKRLDPDSH